MRPISAAMTTVFLRLRAVVFCAAAPTRTRGLSTCSACSLSCVAAILSCWSVRSVVSRISLSVLEVVVPAIAASIVLMSVLSKAICLRSCSIFLTA